MGNKHLMALLATLGSLSVTQAIIETSSGQYPDRCPSQCNGPPSTWTYLHRLQDLEHCDKPVLFDFNVQNLVTDPGTTITIRACSPDGEAATPAAHRRKTPPSKLAEIEDAIAADKNCGASVKHSQVTAKAGSSSNSKIAAISEDDVSGAVELLATYLENNARCGTSIMFAKNKGSVLGMYSGAQVQKESAVNLAKSFGDLASGSHIFEICEGNNTAAHTFGIFAGQMADLGDVQDAVKSWTNSRCLTQNSLGPVDGVKMGVLISSVEEEESASSNT